MAKRKYFYKFISSDGSGPYAYHFKYDLTGKWMHTKGKLKWCKNGFHVCSVKQLSKWSMRYHNWDIWLVEVKGDTLKPHDNKFIYQSIRFVKRIGRATHKLIDEAEDVFRSYSNPTEHSGYLLGLIVKNEKKAKRYRGY